MNKFSKDLLQDMQKAGTFAERKASAARHVVETPGL